MWIAAVLAVCTAAADEGVKFIEGSWDNALKEAAKTEKLVFADASVPGRDAGAGGLGEFWFLAAAGALALVAVEWYLYHHRITV